MVRHAASRPRVAMRREGKKTGDEDRDVHVEKKLDEKPRQLPVSRRQAPYPTTPQIPAVWLS